MTRGILALCLAAALAACVDRTGGQPYSTAVADWVGRSGQELIDDWGQPTEVADAGKGQKVLVYKTRFYLNNTNGWNYCTTRFQVDKTDKIIATRVEREGSEIACSDGTKV
jgi:hypothetical protein